MPEITARTFKGTRDFLPEDMRIRENIMDAMKWVFTRYGFAPLVTPAFEFLDILAGKYGEDADKLLYPLAYKGGKELALRYDLTVPLARVIAMNPHLPKPFKRYQIQPVWRADNPQIKRGRYREFYQCDVDTVGSDEMIADAEIIALMCDVFEALKFKKFEVRLNNRKILRGIILGAGLGEESEHDICRSIDKLDKEGLKFVRKELLDKQYPEKSVEKICSLLKNRVPGREGASLLSQDVPSSEALETGLDEISSIYTALEAMGVPKNRLVFDFTLARGLDYYTGPIFEVVLPERPEVGSVAGGGRYDDLVGLFMKESIPAVGTSFGLERIHSIIKDELEEQNILHNDIDFLVCYFDESLRADSLRLVQELRRGGLRSEMYYKPDKLKKQFGYADKKNIPYVVIFGQDEKENNTVTIKDMTSGTQKSLNAINWIAETKKLLHSS